MTRGGGRRGASAASLIKDPARYKTELCATYSRTGGCPYGHKCQFAHGVEELRMRQPAAATPFSSEADASASYKTKECRSFARTGRCPYGPRCRFMHGDVVEAQQLAMLRLAGEDQAMGAQATAAPPFMQHSGVPSTVVGPSSAAAGASQPPQQQQQAAGSVPGVLLPYAQLPHQGGQKPPPAPMQPQQQQRPPPPPPPLPSITTAPPITRSPTTPAPIATGITQSSLLSSSFFPPGMLYHGKSTAWPSWSWQWSPDRPVPSQSHV
mmetsp:Transcript_44121/g.130051  ORF Transcript_44121/g.130051 Transcript_44121/m.130051 type:complete len:266 (-) Transcript_44121:804-1601(-)